VDVRNKVFISYAHTDTEVATDFLKHLNARLGASIGTWIDKEIRAGDDWESEITGALATSTCAVLLVSVDFLNSEYIRGKELPLIIQGRDNGLRVIPIVVRPCPWTEDVHLKALQLGLPPDPSLLELKDRSTTQYEAAIERVCEVVAGYVGELAKQTNARTQDDVRDLVASIGGLEILDAKQGGDYSIVYRAMKDGREVAVKVLKSLGAPELAEPFSEALGRAIKLEHPCFVPILNGLMRPGRPPVLVLPWIRSSHLLQHITAEPLPLDKTATFLRRACEALATLHDAGGMYGVLTPDNVYIEERLDIPRFPAISVFGFLTTAQRWTKYLGNKAIAATYLVPEQYYGEPLTAKSDQFALGQIAVEALCGAAPVPVQQPADLARKEYFFESPEEFVRSSCARAEWCDDHPKLAEIVFRMLRRDPQRRWASLHDIARELGFLEDEARAIAKTVYLELEDDNGFYEAFYKRFFERCESARQKFAGLDMAKQHAKLQAALVGVLNFREGAEPTTLYPYLRVHLARGVNAEELEAFQQSLVEILGRRYPKDPKKVAAWSKLLPPVMEYMKRACSVPAAQAKSSG
jgi:hypothetical protein